MLPLVRQKWRISVKGVKRRSHALHKSQLYCRGHIIKINNTTLANSESLKWVRKLEYLEVPEKPHTNVVLSSIVQ